MKNPRWLISALVICTAVLLPFATSWSQTPAKHTQSRLNSQLEDGQAYLWHLYHSGLLVKTSGHILIFDYWPGPNAAKVIGELSEGLLDFEHLSDHKVVVFISHEHHDHFTPDLIQWAKVVSDVRFIVSEEVSEKDERYDTRNKSIAVLGPNETTHVGELAIETLKSTDTGLAFLVKVDGLTLYHSGDHASWNWNGDPDADFEFASKLTAAIADEEIDIAMNICDPRLQDSGWEEPWLLRICTNPNFLFPYIFVTTTMPRLDLPNNWPHRSSTYVFGRLRRGATL